MRAQPGPRLACGKPGLQITSISDASPHLTMLHIAFLMRLIRLAPRRKLHLSGKMRNFALKN
jgi:hypothetical protein